MFRCFGGYPEVVGLRPVGVATARLPTPANVTRTCRALHPIGLAALVRVPLGDWRRSFSPRTRFESDGSAGLHGRVCPARPHSRTASGHEIESGDYSSLVAKDYFQKPLSNWTTHSRGNPALRDTNVTVGKLRLLSRMVSSDSASIKLCASTPSGTGVPCRRQRSRRRKRWCQPHRSNDLWPAR